MKDPATSTEEETRSPTLGRWGQLLVGIICMSMISNLQYGWTLFVKPISARFHWEEAAIQLAFTIFVLTETFLMPVEGYLVDRFGPRRVVVSAAVLVGLSWVLNSFADSLFLLYVGAVVGGIGAAGAGRFAVARTLKPACGALRSSPSARTIAPCAIPKRKKVVS